ncbi:MAG TPA: PVC-type heme-binding CxxCH protein, partial [Planctomycetota bacterium]|nr:PVC-type heme-binding CxxCH protein [Planctomycetota bacterium]
LAFEDQGPRGPDAAATNARLAAYAQAMREVARERGVAFVDLFALTRVLSSSGEPLTRDGLHLGDVGAARVARAIEASLCGAPAGWPDDAQLQALRALVQAKDKLWFDVYQASDGNNVYGGRSTLVYDGVSNAEVLERERQRLEVRADNADRRIHAAARAAPEEPESAEPPTIPVATNRPGPLPGGTFEFLGGEAALGKMTVGDGLAVNLFASEERFPELAKPVQMSFDTRGRLWVATWPGYPHPTPDDPRPDRLLILQDDDGDGVADSCRTFADGLRNPTGFEFWNGGVFLAQAPDLLFLKDTDGDDVADVREVVLSGLSSADTHHTANSFVLGPDGALYFQEGIFHQSQIETAWGPVRNHDACVWRFEPRTGRLERAAAYDFLNPHGHVFDRWGQDIITDGTTNENYVAAPLAGWLPPDEKHEHYFPFFPQRSRPAGGTEILSSRAFPPELQGNELIANVIGFQGIFRYRLDPEGAGLSGTEEQPILFSADPNFRPVDLEMGPDGALYVLDWQTPLIGHMQHHLRDPNRDHAHGRIYRVTPAGAPLEVPAAIAGQPVPALLELLKSPDDRVRYRARLELSAHDASEVVAETGHWAATLDVHDPDREHQLLEAVWTLQQQGVVDEVLLERVLRSPEPRARAAAVRVVRQMRGQVERPLERLASAAVDDDPRVRLEAVVALSFFPDPHAAELALGVLRFPMDRFLDYALDETLRALQPQWRGALAAGRPFAADDPQGLAFALARLDAADLAGVQPCAALSRELLGRPGLSDERYVAAATDLAARNGDGAADELVAAIRTADLRSDAHADHLLAGLFGALATCPASDARLEEALGALGTAARRASTRQLATAARVRRAGALGPAWKEALASPAALADLIDAVPLLSDPTLQAELFPHLPPLLDGLPPELGPLAGDATVGRFVRVELPGPSHTLTLAEVQVLSRGENVAPRGRASQSSTAWSGVAERAIDGNTSGTFADDGQTHTVEDQPDPWWELDLGRPLPLDSVTLWNRTDEDGRFAARLDGWVVRVLDEQRRTVFEAHGERAPAPSLTLPIGGPALRVRRAAVRALGALAAAGVHTDEVVAALVPHWQDEDLRADVTAALGSIPPRHLVPGSVAALVSGVDALLAAQPEERYATDDGRRLLALVDELLPSLAAADAPRAAALAAERRRHGPQVLVLRPVRDSLQYDRRELTVVAGRPVELLFENVDIMPHNLVLAAPGALARVGLAAEALAARPDAASSGWVPDLPEVLHATRLLQPGESQTLAFDAPAQPGDFPYVCTFPGHWVRMNGVLHVVAEGAEPDAMEAVAHAPDASAAPSRTFVRDWTPEDFAGALASATHADPAAGRAVLDAAACLKCHAIDGAGEHTGPDLRDVAARWAGPDLLLQVLRPSQVIADGYASELLFLRDGGVVSGRVMGEDGDGVDVLDNPYSAAPRRVPRASIEERRPSAVSIMPEGLLSTFSREEVVELVAYLESLRVTPAERN